MSEQPWADHYETLQLSSSADPETVERVYRLLAKRFHPDNPSSGDVDRFEEVTRAYHVLSDPEARASYDATYESERSRQWRIFRQDSAEADQSDDQRIFHGILSLLYVARRRDPLKGGMAPLHIERLLGVPREHLDFPFWYLKKRGFVEVMENGLIAITVDGIDKLGSGELSLPADRLIAEKAVAGPEVRRTGPHALPEARESN